MQLNVRNISMTWSDILKIYHLQSIMYATDFLIVIAASHQRAQFF